MRGSSFCLIIETATDEKCGLSLPIIARGMMNASWAENVWADVQRVEESAATGLAIEEEMWRERAEND